MKKLLTALIATLVGITSLAAEDPWYFGTCTECFGFDTELSFDIGGGYRQDNLQWDSFPEFPEGVPAARIKEKWNDLQMGVVETNGQLLICNHFVVKADFNYGWFNNENGKQTIEATDLASGTLAEQLQARTTGRVYDISGAIGYQFNFCCFKYALTPLVGYSYYYQKFKNEEYFNNLDPSNEPLFAQNRYINRWRGPTVGGTIAMALSCDWQIFFTYNYHWLRFKGSVDENFVVNQTKFRQTFHGAGGNEFLLGTVYQFSDYWFLAIKVDYKCFTGDKGSFIVAGKHFDELDDHSKNPKFPMRKLKWQSLVATIDVGTVF